VVLTSINPHRWPACATLTCTSQSRIDTMPMKRPKRSLASNVSDWQRQEAVEEAVMLG
jgi:hypothetical protein